MDQLKKDEIVLIGELDENQKVILDEKYKRELEKKLKEFKDKVEIERKVDINQADYTLSEEDIANYRKIKEKQGENKQSEKKKEKEKKEVKEETEHKDQDLEEKIAIALGISKDQILNVVDIVDEKTMSNVINKDMERMNLKAVKLRQSDNDGQGNDWVFVNIKGNNEVEVADNETIAHSKPMQNIASGLNIKNNMQNTSIGAGDLNANPQPRSNEIVTEINRYRFNDVTVLMETKRYNNETEIHCYKENDDGSLEPLCEGEHGKHEAKEIKLPDRNVKVEEDEEEKGRSRAEEADPFNHNLYH